MTPILISPQRLYGPWLKHIFYWHLGLLLLMTLGRLGFMFFFGPMDELAQIPQEIAAALFLGLRYDWIIVCYLTALPFLLIHFALFFHSEKMAKKVSLTLGMMSFIGTALIVWGFIFDYGFYSYFQDHLNVLFFGFLEDDTKAVLLSIWKNYNLPLWLTLVGGVVYSLWRAFKWYFSPFHFVLNPKRSHWGKVVIFLIGMVVLSFGARGNFKRKPLSYDDAYISKHTFVNKLSLNGYISFQRALKLRKYYGGSQVNYLERMGYNSWLEPLNDLDIPIKNHSDFLPNLEKITSKKTFSPPHVILVVMESFGSFWLPYQSNQFDLLGSLAPHFESDIVFKNFLSADNGTIGSTLAVATGTILRPGCRYYSEGPEMNTKLSSSANIAFEKAGYETHFIYGGNLGWRNLGNYFSLQGFDHIYGGESVVESVASTKDREQRDIGNEWGIFDEYIYEFIEDKLKSATRPQFFMVLTTTNHPPFEFPRQYQVQNLKINYEMLDLMTIDEEMARQRFSSLQYANSKIGDFVSRIKDSNLKEKTVLALTGDHSFWVSKKMNDNDIFRKNAVPFYLYLPESIKPKKIDVNKFGSHEDILPTLYELVLSEIPYLGLGEDLINEAGMSLNSSDTIYDHDGGIIEHSCYQKSDNGFSLVVDKGRCDDKLQKRKAWISLTDEYLRSQRK